WPEPNAEASALMPTVNAALDILLRQHIIAARRTILGDAALPAPCTAVTVSAAQFLADGLVQQLCSFAVPADSVSVSGPVAFVASPSGKWRRRAAASDAPAYIGTVGVGVRF